MINEIHWFATFLKKCLQNDFASCVLCFSFIVEIWLIYNLIPILYLLQGKIMSQGKLLLYGPLVCCEGTSAHNFRGKDLMVFLFEQSIIFSESGRKKNQFSNPVYAYKSHLQVCCVMPLLRLLMH